MTDKIKLNLCSYTYYILIEDMFDFGFMKSDGSINKQGFLIHLITKCYAARKEKFKLIKKLTDNNKYTYKILQTLDYIENDDIDTNYHHKNFTIEPTKTFKVLLDEIEANELNFELSLQSFLRNMLNEYVHLPKYKREKILFADEYNKIKKVIYEKNIIILNLGTETLNLAPIILSHSFNETFNYCLCKNLNSKTGTFISIKLCKFTNLIVKDRVYIIHHEEIKRANEMVGYGIQYASLDVIKFSCSFTKKGFHLFDSLNLNRPHVINYENDIYTITCTRTHFNTYLRPLGREMKIIEPQELIDSVKRFYLQSLNIYE